MNETLGDLFALDILSEWLESIGPEFAATDERHGDGYRPALDEDGTPAVVLPNGYAVPLKEARGALNHHLLPCPAGRDEGAWRLSADLANLRLAAAIVLASAAAREAELFQRQLGML